MSELIDWNSFYVIVGSSAGALIGLQFVVLTLIAERPRLGTADGRRRLCDAERRSFRSRALVVSRRERSMACDRRRRNFLGISGPWWNSVRRDRCPANASANCLPASI